MNPTVFRRMQSNWGRRAHGDFTDHCFYENGFCVHCDHFFSGTGSRIWRGAYPQQKAAAGLRRYSDASYCPAAYGGMIFPVVHLWGKTPGGEIFSGIFRDKDCIFMAGNSIGSSGDFVPFDVPFGKRSAAAGR